MATEYRLFGLETSPFSIKVRSYLRYKKLPFEWVVKGFGTEEAFRALAKSDALPMLVSPNGGVAHDSSLILTRIEAARVAPSATPTDPACAAIAALLEEYADEWLNKAMFHYRWGDAKSAKTAATRQVEQIFSGFNVENADDIEKSMAKSMSGRLKTVGLSKKNGAIVEASFERFINLLNAHLEHHLFLFGGHPSLADFALAGQLIQLMMDDRSGELIREKAPFVTAWCEFMEDPRPGAPFEDLDTLKDTLLPLIRDEVVPAFVAWSLANEASIDKKRKTLTADILGEEYKQSVQTHSCAAFADVKDVFAFAPATDVFTAFLEQSGLSGVFPVGTKIAELVEPTPATDTDDDPSDTETDDEADQLHSEGTPAPDASETDKPKKRSRSRRRPRRSRTPKDADGKDTPAEASSAEDPGDAETPTGAATDD